MTRAKNNLSTLGERGLLKKILPALGKKSSIYLVPPGDDAAVLRAGRQVLTIDGLTEGTHFKLSWEKKCRQTTGLSLARALGWKLIGSSASDLAAMGSTKNRWAMIYLGAPGSVSWKFLKELQRGINEAAARVQCTIVGGDTVRAKEISLVAAVGATLDGPRALTRDGARAGDLLCVAGTVGDAAIGLDILEGKKKSSQSGFFVRRFFEHKPMLQQGRLLSLEKSVSSLIDLSDSVKDTVEILSEMSGVGAQVNIDRVPVSDLFRRDFFVNENILGGGEDYSLMFTIRASALNRLQKKMKFSIIGRIVPASKKISYFLHGRPVKPPKAFEQFQ